MGMTVVWEGFEVSQKSLTCDIQIRYRRQSIYFLNMYFNPFLKVVNLLCNEWYYYIS